MSEIGELFGALAKAQGEMEAARKDRRNEFFRSSYADLSSVWDACRGPLSANDLCVIQSPEPTEGAFVTVLTTLGHQSGVSVSSRTTLPVLPDKKGNLTAQSYGSALTYARRYGLMAMVGIAPADDDDGNAASRQKERPTVSWGTTTAGKAINELLPDVPEIAAEVRQELGGGLDPVEVLKRVLAYLKQQSNANPAADPRSPAAGSGPEPACMAGSVPDDGPKAF